MNVARLTLVTVAVLLLAVAATGGAVGQEEDPVTLTVEVTDQNGDAVGGVTVEAAWETDSGDTGTASGTTASNGNVLLDVPEGSSVELNVDDDTYIRNRPVQVDSASESEIALEVSRSGTATVTVLDDQNRSQADATVTVREDGRSIDRGETDSDGSYETARLERGTYEIAVVKPGYYETEREVTVSLSTEVTVEIQRGTVTLDVRTFDDHFEPPQPIDNGSVRVSSSVYDGEVSVTEGMASLNVPVNAEYTVQVVKDDYDATPKRVKVRESAISTNVSAQRAQALSVTSANDRVLVGETTRVTVRNAYGERVAGASVTVDGDEVGETDDRGEIDVPISSAGDRTIVAQDGSVESDPVTVEGVETADEADPDPNESNDTDGSANTDDGAPGFGVVATLLALLAAAAVAGRRRSG
ncbi:carboxypeptidase regulatory-like domain-containing protein [Halorubrum sp. HHNYT27]|uniref:carboxypeptidase regulatory-like domain-containing protein n=1 Tax=Halorubrum sp. HHNYT27 TaxID=3402275 RepID=UPI003EBD3ABE